MTEREMVSTDRREVDNGGRDVVTSPSSPFLFV